MCNLIDNGFTMEEWFIHPFTSPTLWSYFIHDIITLFHGWE